jgi:DNA gyrase subunit B
MDNTKKQKQKNTYGAENITVLEGLEPVRKRPGMYIGSTSSTGLYHLIWEVVDNGIDEAMAGHANELSVTLLPDNMVQVSDNGRGIPVEKHKSTGLSALETVLTKLHAGGKFGDGGGYKVSGGLHGVGVSVVNALSIYLKAEVHRDGKIWEQEYSIGKSKAKPKVIGKSKKTGTIITFKADESIFSEIEYDWGKILDRLRQQSYLTKGTTIIARDKRGGHREKEYKFYFEGGIKSYIKSLHRTKNPKHKSIFYFEKDVEDAKVEIALQYNDEYNETVLSFANNIHNPDGGTHLSGFKTALTRTLNSYARNQKILKDKEENLSGDDVREGLTAIISVKLTDPQFEGQTKGKLGNTEIKTYVEQSFGEAFSIFLGEHPKEAEAIIGKCIISAQARLAARTARATILRKGALEGMTLPGKLADCSSRKPEESELYIVEGDSAGGCFSGATKVALTDGRNLSFIDLIKEEKAGKQNYCYTNNDDGDIAIEKILNPRLSKKNTEVIKIILDNNEEIICTPDHKFRLADGAYIEARNLDSNMSLTTFDKKLYKNKKNANSIIKVLTKNEKIDVYDIEVPHTHNFALASGVFVHNSAKQGRNRRFQAILPLRGKILNVEKARMDKMLANNEIKNLVIALGANIDEQLDLEKLRYHRIIIMTDADVDGAHIRTLLLTLFFRHFYPLITNGNLYIAQPPLYQIKKGNQVRYAYTEADKVKIIKDLGGDIDEEEIEKTAAEEAEGDGTTIKAKGQKIGLQRYKGLGEMNPNQLWETTMDPENRILKKVTVEDAVKADQIFDMLMGSDVAPRKHFIQTHAKKVENLDV